MSGDQPDQSQNILIRLDQCLVDQGLAPSRTKAKELIESGVVEVKRGQGFEIVKTPSFKVASSVGIHLRDQRLLKYVSRAGLKLEGALQHIDLDVTGLEVLDVGISTGGFTDCLLQAGAKQVVGIDVGRDQLAESLRADPRLLAFEGVNVREIKNSQAVFAALAAGVDVIVVDVSFISLTQVLPLVVEFMRPEAVLLALVKPQFEVGRSGLNKKGVVKDDSLYDEVQKKVADVVGQLGLRALEFFVSPIQGRDGNQEFFIYAKK